MKAYPLCTEGKSVFVYFDRGEKSILIPDGGYGNDVLIGKQEYFPLPMFIF